KLLHQRPAFVRSHTGNDLNSVIQDLGSAYPKMRSDRAKTLVVSSVNKSLNAGVDEGSGAHRTWLDGRINGCASKTMVANSVRGLTQSQDFGVRGRVVIIYCSIECSGEQFTIGTHNTGADRHFVHRAGFRSLVHCNHHPLLVSDIHFSGLSLA